MELSPVAAAAWNAKTRRWVATILIDRPRQVIWSGEGFKTWQDAQRSAEEHSNSCCTNQA